jgi:hypothetical protein
MNITHEDAVTLISVSIEALLHRRRVGPGEALDYMPVGLLRMALVQLDNGGADTSSVRAQLKDGGFDFSEIPYCAQENETRSDEHSENDTAQQVSRVPAVIAAAILAKFQAGWSKSRIAREFRLNRRTIIRICAGR